LENIAEIDRRTMNYLEIQNKVFAKSEQLAQRSIILTKVSKIAGRVGLAGAAVLLLTGVSPDAKKAVKDVASGVGSAAGGVYDVAKFTLGTAAGYRNPPNPIDELVEDYVEEKKKTLDFMDKVGKIDKSNDPRKQEQIENLCVEYWDNPQIRTWALTHKKELNIRSIMLKVKQKILQTGDRLMPGGKLRPANMELLKGAGGGSKSLELK
jgi:hypothetical protein